MVRLIKVPIGAVVVDSVKATLGGLSAMLLVAIVVLLVRPTLSVALT